jgi:hypothetical protein
MFSNRAGIQLIPLIAAAMFIPPGLANEVSWIQGQTCPSAWSVEPVRPRDTDVIQFSGPVRFYLNRCLAERTLGGKPRLLVDHTGRTIELRFEPPASSDCTGFWSPVCGLKGSFGPLDGGQWRFFSNVGGTTFSVEFAVGGDAAIQFFCYVDPNAPGAGTGSSWKDALNSLQDALAIAGEGTEIRVARGAYRPDAGADIERGDRNATFRLKKGVVLKGGYAGWRGVNPNARDILAFETILSGDLFDDDEPLSRLSEIIGDFSRLDNSSHVVTISGTDSAAVLDGFTIMGGVAADTTLPDDLNGGGGIYNDGGNATIRNCLIVDNGADYYGAGFYSRGKCTPVLIDCTVANNWTNWAGGGIYYHWGSDLIMTRCVVTSNGAEFQGGGICSHSGGQLLISNSIISGNRANDSTWSRGGGLYGSVANAHVNHCTFVGNQAAAGSAVACDVFSESDASEMHLSNCILWGDAELIEAEGQTLVEITHSSVRGAWPGEGNLDADPCFVQMGYWDDARTASDPCDDTWMDGDYHLRWSSPCVDTASLDAVWEPNGTDLDGQPRVSGITADMGAYELRNDPPVANAGRDVMGFTLDKNMKATVVLDAGKSYDPEGLPLHYRWYYNNEVVCEQARFTTELLVGAHTFRLEVGDPTGLTASDEATATVTLVIGTKTFVSPQKLQRNSSQDVLALTVLPRGKFVKDFDAAEPLLLFPGGISAVKQSAFVWLSGDTMVLGTFKRADLMAAAPANGRTELRVVGRLKDGQHFSAVDYVTIE